MRGKRMSKLIMRLPNVPGCLLIGIPLPLRPRAQQASAHEDLARHARTTYKPTLNLYSRPKPAHAAPCSIHVRALCACHCVLKISWCAAHRPHLTILMLVGVNGSLIGTSTVDPSRCCMRSVVPHRASARDNCAVCLRSLPSRCARDTRTHTHTHTHANARTC